jgi:serine/threonine protein kinase
VLLTWGVKLQLAKARLEGKSVFVQFSYDMWMLGVFVYELSTGEPYWPPRMTDGQVLHVLSEPSMRLPHESRPVSIDLVNRILKQLLTRDESTRLDSVALKALLDHEEETGTLSSTMNSTMNPVPQPNVVLEGIGGQALA